MSRGKSKKIYHLHRARRKAAPKTAQPFVNNIYQISQPIMMSSVSVSFAKSSISSRVSAVETTV